LCLCHFRNLFLVAVSYSILDTDFQYLWHMVTHTLSVNDDMQRQIRNLFTRTNILARGFAKCSTLQITKLVPSDVPSVIQRDPTVRIYARQTQTSG